MAWMAEHAAELRRSVADQRILYWSLAIALVVGLLAHGVGYLVKASAPSEPLALIADLVYSLGFALWTGVVVVLFAQIIPEAKRRQIKRALDAYDATVEDTGAVPRDHRLTPRPK
jgi:hypothetical protein